MTSRKRKSEEQEDAAEGAELEVETDAADGVSAPAAPRRIRHIQPLGPRVLVKILSIEDRSAAGLYLPASVTEKHQEALFGEVVEVARAAPEDDATLGENVSGIPAGVLVLFPKDSGTRVPWDANLRIVATKEILATVEELDYEEAH